MRPLWIKAALSLAAVWLIAGSVMRWAGNAKPTPESVAKYLGAHAIEGRSPQERREVIDGFASRLSRLDFDERRVARMDKRPGDFFKSLTVEEQAYFIDQTAPAGFKQMMEALNNMPPEKRVSFVVRAMNDMRKEREGGKETPPRFDDPNVQKIMAVGLKTFFGEASPEIKMALVPLIEEMQRNLMGR